MIVRENKISLYGLKLYFIPGENIVVLEKSINYSFPSE